MGSGASTAGATWDGLLDVLDACTTALADLGGRGWLVGGCLRDALLGRPVRDVDLVVTIDPLALARRVAPSGTLGLAVAPLGTGHGTHTTVRVTCAAVGVEHPGWQLDLSALHAGTIAADLMARDFSINALALPLAAHPALVALARGDARERTARDQLRRLLLDPSGGLGDVRARVLRVVSATALADDPLRIVRGARLAAALHLTLDPTTVQLARAACVALSGVARERIGEELRAMLALPTPAMSVRGCEHLHTLGALAVVLPELYKTWATAAVTDRSAHVADAADTPHHALATLAALPTAQEAILRQVAARKRTRVRAQLETWLMQPLAAGRSRAVALRWAALLYALGDQEIADTPASAADITRSDRPALATPLAAVAARVRLARRERAMIGAVAREQQAAWALVTAANGVDAEADTEALASASRLSGADDLRTARHWFARTGDAGIATLIVAVACAEAHAPPDGGTRASGALLAQRAANLLTRYLLDHEQVVPPPLMDGAGAMRELGVSAGPALGRLLARVRAAQLDGVVTTSDQALQLARSLLADDSATGG